MIPRKTSFSLEPFLKSQPLLHGRPLLARHGITDDDGLPKKWPTRTMPAQLKAVEHTVNQR